MGRNLAVLGTGHSKFAEIIRSRFKAATTPENAKRPGDAQINADHLLLIDASTFADSDLLGDPLVSAALEQGVPIVLDSPRQETQRQLTGTGVDKAEAALIVKGTGPFYYVQLYMGNASTDSGAARLARNRKSGKTTRELIDVPASRRSPEQAAEAVLEDLGNLATVERQLGILRDSPFQKDAVPESRKWSTYLQTDWISSDLTDPYGEYPGTQYVRLQYSVTLNLLAADDPAKVKILSAVIGGSGFDPGSTIHYGDHYKGWGQTLTYLELAPQDGVLGPVEDYVPINQADVVSISAGFSWNVGFTAGGSPQAPEGSVSFNYSQDQSHTKSSESFKTLTSTVGSNGMRFYHNAYIFGNKHPIEVDMVEIFDIIFNSNQDWDDELDKLFYGDESRQFPNLSLALLKPDSECVWYSAPTESGITNIRITGEQGCLFNHGNLAIREVAAHQYGHAMDIVVDFNQVHYDG